MSVKRFWEYVLAVGLPLLVAAGGMGAYDLQPDRFFPGAVLAIGGVMLAGFCLLFISLDRVSLGQAAGVAVLSIAAAVFGGQRFHAGLGRLVAAVWGFLTTDVGLLGAALVVLGVVLLTRGFGYFDLRGSRGK